MDRTHDLLTADGHPIARLEVAADRGAGRAVPAHGTPLDFVRPSAVARRWEVRQLQARWGHVEKPSAVRERFAIVPDDAPDQRIEPHGVPWRRHWTVRADGGRWARLDQGVVRRRWHEVRLAAPLDVRPGTEDERSLLVVAWIVALVDTTPPSGVRGLRAGGAGSS
ncbi:MAG: hypothetical protein JJT89_03420 [Nitriliruptoraceae bacterium]|nr:hypothetical protein [Nitriliruptoraceae bacterium]